MTYSSITLAGTFLLVFSMNIQAGENAFQHADLTPFFKKATDVETVMREGIPLHLDPTRQNVLSLKDAGWAEWKTDPATYLEAYDSEVAAGNPAQPTFSLPNKSYTAAYLFAAADPDEALTNRVTLRLGRRIKGSGAKSQVSQFDFVAEIPRSTKGEELQYHLIRIPLPEALAQQVEGDVIDLEVTKELRLARRKPDPNRFRWRPLGPTSGVKIAALTLEESPLQMTVQPSSATKLYELPGAVTFEVELANPTTSVQPYRAVLVIGGWCEEQKGTVDAGGNKTISLAMTVSVPGHHSVDVELYGKDGELINRYRTFAGVLPKDQRRYRSESALGTWGTRDHHFYPSDPEMVGQMYRQLGLRYGMFNYTAEERTKYGVLRGNGYKVNMATKEPDNAAQQYQKLQKEHPDLTADFYIFHEDGISGKHATRIPDIFHDRPPYQLDETEQKRLEAMMDLATRSTRSMRAAHPEVKIHLGNGGLPLREEFYRHKFPSELFDTAGNESGAFSRPPETQPPDVIGNNASLWMDRQMLNHYGYGEKELFQCYEITYPGSNPGNLSYQTQADYFVRNILHSLAWKIPSVRVGGIADPGNSYRFSNWGGAGLFTARPDLSPKPAAVAIATLTRLLDGISYRGFIETGSSSVYLLNFARKDRQTVLPYWTVRGTRPMHLTLFGTGSVEIHQWSGASEEVSVKNGRITLQATASPAWLLLPNGMKVKGVALGEPDHASGEPTGTVTEVDALASLETWNVAEERNALLEFYNPLTPRRKGNFTVTPVEQGGIRVQPKPVSYGKETMPMYGELVSMEDMPLPGKPVELGVWIKGNSSWGRLIYELEDASGQRWTSIGAKAKSGGSPWMADWLGAELASNYRAGETADWNTDDAWGLSRINFDGWRYVGVPLPGQYPGEGYHWPANSQWRWDKDGIVHYPLKLVKIIVELPEKTLYLTRYEPVLEQGIELKKLVTVEKPQENLKTDAPEYIEAVQMNVR